MRVQRRQLGQIGIRKVVVKVIAVGFVEVLKLDLLLWGAVCLSPQIAQAPIWTLKLST